MNRKFGWAVLLASVSPGVALAQVAVGPVTLDAGGTVLAGAGGLVLDETAEGEAGYRRSAASAPLYLLAKLSASTTLDDDLTGSAFLRVKPYQTPGSRGDVLPDADEIVKDAYLRLKSAVWGNFGSAIRPTFGSTTLITPRRSAAASTGFSARTRRK